MTTVVLFHSVLGIRQGELDAVERLRADGHTVHLPDLYGGRQFDTYEPALAFSRELGEELFVRGAAAVADVPDGFVVGGFSQGSGVAVGVAVHRAVSGVLQFHGAAILEWFGEDAAWPAGVDSQSHQMVGDPWREDEYADQATQDVASGGGRLEFFDYPGSGHLFTDPTLPDEYDAAATELLWSRVLPFVRDRDTAGAPGFQGPGV